MLPLDLYYSAKPWLPVRLRMACRRWHARRIRRRSGDVWPVLESAGRKPEGWPGWPDGKQFAFVLTHDIESEAGMRNVKPLAELEMSLGFRSAFFFVPEGEYTVPAKLRHWLADHGFEVGVHDLHHDGKLYRSRGAFRQHALRINRYLKEWNAVGFRSAFMLRELGWLHDLDIAYDASTFDTDPFEPQPDGVGTIFPFWVPSPGLQDHGPRTTRPAGGQWSEVSNRVPSVGGSALRIPNSALKNGYVELPYTLPQDSTLFLLFDERGPDIWLRKMDWIASHNGMVLVNIHPDYLAFGAKSPGAWKYPVSRCRKLLEHLHVRHASSYWSALPKEVTQWAIGSQNRQSEPFDLAG
jgi:hypothetical protein